MSLTAGPRWNRTWALACVVVVLAGHFVGLWAIRRSRTEALNVAVLGMRVDLAERARSLEATLRSSAAELRFLATSPALADLPAGLSDEDPAVARFRRLEAEGRFLRYLTAHPEIERLFVRDSDGATLVAVGRRASFPVPLPPSAVAAASTAGRLRQEVELPDGAGELVADLHPAGLLSSLATGTGRAVLLDAEGSPLAGTPEAFRRLRDAGDPPGEGWVRSGLEVEPPGLPTDRSWTLVRAEREDELLAGLGSVAGGYQALLLLDGLAVLATVALGLVAVRQAQRRARLEEAAAQRERLAAMEARVHEADRLASVGRVAATLAHEVRNPLEGMRNWLSLAEQEARALESERLLGDIRRVGEGIDRLAEVVRRVLQLARPSGGGRESRDHDEVVRETVASIESTRPFRDHRILVECHGDLPRLSGDKVLLGQLLLNLLLNARDATPGGGPLEVSTGVEGRHAHLRVRDHGPGLDPELAPRLFEPFASGKASTGLGLSLCARVANVHGGAIEARNAEGGGALFELSLPVEGEEAPAVEEIPQ